MAKKKTFKCRKCGRTFSMAAHLARHTGTIHGSKRKGLASATKKVARPRVKSRVARPKVKRTAPARLGMGEAARWIGPMKSCADELAKRRVAIDREITAIESALAALGGTAGAARGRPRRTGRVTRPKAVGKVKVRAGARAGGRAARPGSLRAYMTRVLNASSKPMSPKRIAAAVVKAGYKTKSKNLVRAVSNSLGKVKGVRRVGYGQYKT